MSFSKHITYTKCAALLLLLCMLLPILCGCAMLESVLKPAPKETIAEHTDDTATAGLRRTTLYFQTDDGLMVPVMKLMPWEEGIGKAALNQLVDTEENRIAASAMGLKNVIPQGVTFVLRISDDAVATLNIIDLPKLESASAEQALICAVVNTLTEFPTIDQVKLKFDGNTVRKLSHGTRVDSAMRTLPLNMEPMPVTASKDDATHALTLYFPNQSASLYVPVTRSLTREPDLALAMQELAAGPVDDALRECLPAGTQVLSASIIDDAANINFSSEFSALADDPILEAIALDVIQLTAQQFGMLSTVNIQVNGETYETASQTGGSIPTFANTFR